MNSHELEATLAAAYPVDRERIERLDIESMEADLLADLEDAPAMPAVPAPRRPLPPRRRLALGLVAAALAAAVVAIVALAGGGTGQPSRAYGAELIRFAERSPLLLLEGPEWGIRNIDQLKGGEGRIEFTQKSPDPHPDEPLMTRADAKRHFTPPAVIQRRQRRVELNWHATSQDKLLFHAGELGKSLYDSYLHKTVKLYEPGPAFKTAIPNLGVTAYVAPRSENRREGGPGDRLMVAFWKEGGHLLELRASVRNLAAFRERLSWLRRVGTEEWLDAMPTRVVKSTEYAATVEAILEGIPLPPGFDPTGLQQTQLTTDRYQVGAVVGGAVACEWFHDWGQAIQADDTATVEEAERVLRGAGSWPIFREMAKEGAYPATVVEYAKAMPSRHWYGRPLLPDVEQGLGCATR
jgi:hypothetical protein